MTQRNGCLYCGSSRYSTTCMQTWLLCSLLLAREIQRRKPHISHNGLLMEIPIAMILACRLLPFRANRLANIIAGGVLTLVNGFLTFVPPLAGWGRPPAFPEYLFFGTIETVCTLVIIWQAWTWSGGEAAVSSERIVRQPQAGITSS
jgi:hypothetical protein